MCFATDTVSYNVVVYNVVFGKTGDAIQDKQSERYKTFSHHYLCKYKHDGGRDSRGKILTHDIPDIFERVETERNLVDQFDKLVKLERTAVKVKFWKTAGKEKGRMKYISLDKASAGQKILAWIKNNKSRREELQRAEKSKAAAMGNASIFSALETAFLKTEIDMMESVEPDAVESFHLPDNVESMMPDIIESSQDEVSQEIKGKGGVVLDFDVSPENLAEWEKEREVE